MGLPPPRNFAVEAGSDRPPMVDELLEEGGCFVPRNSPRYQGIEVLQSWESLDCSEAGILKQRRCEAEVLRLHVVGFREKSQGQL
jgi:hypothetical protein